VIWAKLEDFLLKSSGHCVNFNSISIQRMRKKRQSNRNRTLSCFRVDWACQRGGKNITKEYH